ncbi:colipase-like [Protopterus annectens]|uniref:colipase-like n=1 Tax=Protopterus annectens TaxID=7888 RepID=UPI001CFB20C2|nr:colipase-like [Protopterus annectens]
MKSTSILCLCFLFYVAQGIALPKEEPEPDDSKFINLENGELCIEGIQCKSGCCYKRNLLDLARCAPLSKENEECSPDYIWDVYYRCPCEAGLKCETDRTITGGVTHTDFGICLDPRDSKQQQPEKQVIQEQKTEIQESEVQAELEKSSNVVKN